MSFQSLAFFGFLATALAVCLTAGRRSPRAGAAMLANGAQIISVKAGVILRRDMDCPRCLFLL